VFKIDSNIVTCYLQLSPHETNQKSNLKGVQLR